jgi:predicted flap endonuclease-1-like 5' DNA nuclease
LQTFADVANATPAQIEGIIQPQKWQQFDCAGWIEQARQLARGG